MPISCQLCNQIFDNIITSTHLAKHNIKSDEYKNQFGKNSLASDEYRYKLSLLRKGDKNSNFGRTHTSEAKEKISLKNKGKIPHNKNIAMPEEQKILLSIKAKERHKSEWINPNIGSKRSEHTKLKIKEARKKQKITSEAAQKAIATKKKKGQDLAFFRGRKHSEESKQKILNSTIYHRIQKQKLTNEYYLHLIQTKNLILLNDINEHFLTLQCSNCSNIFSRTRQVFQTSKEKDEYCPKCFPPPTKSNAELDLLNFIREILSSDNVLSGDRTQIFPLELDIYIPKYKIAIEYCGLYWHSELQGKDRLYHVKKTEMCEQVGIRLITIFEDEWILKQDIVKQKLIQILHQNKAIKIGARKCKVVELSSTEANRFLNIHHIMGSGRSNVRLGLKYNDTLVSVMTFSNSNFSRKLKVWEIDRYAGLSNSNIVGGASKLFSYFIKQHNPDKVISYADRRWSNEAAFYLKMGMKLESKTLPNYWYFQLPSMQRIHRFTVRKNKKDIPNLTEWENRQAQGYNRIWDCGHLKFTWTQN